MDALVPAAQGGLPVLGICNGFQVLCESHLLPGALIRNDHRKFNCVDQRLVVENASTAWTSDFEAGQEITIVLKNGEGGFVADERTLDELEGEGRVVFRYAGDNPNGSYRAIAGITNDRGNVVGLMPHPEHAVEEGYGPSTDGLAVLHLRPEGSCHRMTAQIDRPTVDTVEHAARRRPTSSSRGPSSASRPTSTPTSARSSAAARPAPSWRCTRSCGRSTAPTSRPRCTSRLWGENTTDEMREKLLVGIGENAGVVDIGDGWAVTFKVESHNHPSYVEPYQGAATGVGGIVRDIMSMGARPIAIMDPLRFGNLHHPDTQRVLPGVVAGVGGYGNCLGLPNIGGEVVFDDCYQGNPLVNALCVGAMRIEDIHLAKASGVGNKVILFGAKTGGDGIGGVSVLASETFDEGGPTKRPAVQVGDPFAEKVLIECCLDLYAAHVVDGIQDLGGAGLSCATSELASNGDGGMQIELDRVPLRDASLRPEEILMSESQERMMAVVEPGTARRVPGDHRPLGRRGHRARRGHRRRPPRHHLARRGHRRRAAAVGRPRGPDLPPPAGAAGIPRCVAGQRHRHARASGRRRRAASPTCSPCSPRPNLCDKSWVTDQYDRYVLGNTALAMPDDAGVVRVDEETGRGVAVSHRLQRPVRQARPVCRGAARARRVLPQRRHGRGHPAGRDRLPQLRVAGGPGRDVAVPRGGQGHRRGLQDAGHPGHRRQRQLLQPDR